MGGGPRAAAVGAGFIPGLLPANALGLTEPRAPPAQGKSGTGPVLYAGACPSTVAEMPANWSVYTWKGVTSPLPLPTIVAAGGAAAPAECVVCTGYTLAGAGTAEANGCYNRVGATSFRHTEDAALSLSRSAEGTWAIAKAGTELYVSTCPSSLLPPADQGWRAASAGKLPPPRFSASIAFPLGYCPPVPPPAPKPHPRCATPECVKLHGPQGCPDLNGIAPDLVRLSAGC